VPSDTATPPPANQLLRFIRWLGGKLVRRSDRASAMEALRDDIAGAIALGHSEGAVEKDARDRLLGALDLTHRTVDEIMRHRRQIEMIDATRTPDEIITQVLASPHTRLPVYRDSDDNILGVVHAKDLLREVDRLVRGEEGSVEGIRALDIEKVAMKPYFIPDTTTLDEQMRPFRAGRRRIRRAARLDHAGRHP
jgi:Mg2+/Co2+ transporter CorB